MASATRERTSAKRLEEGYEIIFHIGIAKSSADALDRSESQCSRGDFACKHSRQGPLGERLRWPKARYPCLPQSQKELLAIRGDWRVKDAISDKGEIKTRERRTGRTRIAMILRLIEG